MNDAFGQFLLKCADNDLSLLHRLSAHTINNQVPENLCKLGMARLIKGAPKDLAVGMDIFALCPAYGLMMAGEAAKEIEIHHPELVNEFPELPWRSLKRLRDTITHGERDFITPFPNNFAKNFAKEFGAVTGQLHQGHLAPSRRDNPRVAVMARGLEFYDCFSKLVTESMPEPMPESPEGLHIMLTSPAAQRAARQLGMAPEGFPLLVAQITQNMMLNTIADDIQHISPFCRALKNSPIAHERIGRIIQTRNHCAHFSASLGADLDPRYHSMMAATHDIQGLRGSLTHFLADKTPDDTQSVAKLAGAYEARLKNTAKPEIRNVLNQAVEAVKAKSKGSLQIEQAYVMATYKLLQTVPAQQVSTILEAVDALPGSIRRPDLLLTQQESGSQMFMVREFLKEMSRQLPQREAPAKAA